MQKSIKIGSLWAPCPEQHWTIKIIGYDAHTDYYYIWIMFDDKAQDYGTELPARHILEGYRQIAFNYNKIWKDLNVKNQDH